MIRRSIKLFPALVIVWSLLILAAVSSVTAQPHLCTDEVFGPLSQGYEALRAGQEDQARLEFEKVITIDRYNPYALNNLAVIAERQGKLKEAMSYLLEAETYAAEYMYKVDEICEGSGLCLAVAPSTQKSQRSSIASLVHSNINLLRTKISKSSTTEPKP